MGQIPEAEYVKKAATLDIEIFPNLMLVSVKLVGEPKIANYIFDETRTPDWDRLRAILRKYTIVTFNGTSFDMPLVFLAMGGASVAEIKEAANRIITTGMKPWDVPRALGVFIPKWLDHVDLIEPNPSIRQSLKVLNGRLHGPWMQDLPYPHDAVLTEEQKDAVVRYCGNDLDATERLYLAMREPLELRDKVSADLGIDVRSKSDAQMGTTILRKRIEDLTGSRIPRTEPKMGISFRYNVPSFIKFETPQLQTLLESIREHEFVTKADGKVDLPKWLSNEKIVIGPSTFQMGIGGLHSTESNRSVLANAANALISLDVRSYYPETSLSLGLYPAAVGPDFLSVYRGIFEERIKAKKEKNKVVDKTLKLVLNGSFGVLGSRYSFMYAPHLLIAITLTGQLSLLMLIERAFLRGIPTVSANTDGAEFLCPRQFFDGWVMHDGATTDRLAPSVMSEVVDEWERETGYYLEGVEYTALYNQSVNSYIALKTDGSHKRKGPISNPWSSDPSENDPRGQMSKNPQMTICSDAVLAFLKHGTPIEQTIRECGDVRQFVTVVNATGGATWREEYLGKVVRYYWAIDGDPIIKVKGHPKTGNRPKVSKTDGSRPLMTLPDDFSVPGDLDYGRYIDEAKAILKDLGWVPASTAQSPWEQLLRRAVQQGVE